MFGNPIGSTNTTKPAKNTTAEALRKQHQFSEVSLHFFQRTGTGTASSVMSPAPKMKAA